MLGAVENWTAVQARAEAPCLFMVADLHAMTMPYDPSLLPMRCKVTAASILACGVDPARAAVFRQSAVREHSELQWVLSTITPLGWLQRMTQFKDKSRVVGPGAKGGARSSGSPLMRRTSEAGLGLLAYPVLQAADILLYRATAVPVGEDQLQHLELTRDVAGAFNALFPDDAGFSLPVTEALLPPGNTARIMSLRDGRKKMSKSDPSAMARIDITDSPDTVARKLRRAKTDALPGLVYDHEQRPERANLLDIFAAVSGRNVEALVAEFEGRDSLAFKAALADAVVSHLAPVQERMRELLGTHDLEALALALERGDAAAVSEALGTTSAVDEILLAGEARARAVAADTMMNVRRLTGLAESP